MENIKNQIDEVILQLEAGKISEADAHLKIAEITTNMPEQDKISEGVKAFMHEEINKMDMSEDEKHQLRKNLEED